MCPTEPGSLSENTTTTRPGLGTQRYLNLFERLAPLVRGHERDEISMRACEMIAGVLEIEACSLMLSDCDQRYLELVAATHIPKEEWPHVRLSIEEGACGRAFQNGRPLLIQGRAEFKAVFGRDPKQRYTSPSCVLVPIEIRGRTAGIVNVSNPKGRRYFETRDLELLQAAVHLIGAALHNARQYHEAIQIQRNLEEMFDSLLMGVLTVDVNGAISHSNRRARELFGDRLEHEKDLTIDDYLPPQVLGVCQKLIRQADQGRHPAQERLDVQLGTAHMKVEITVSRMRCLGEAFHSRLVTFEDVGQEEELRRLREAESMKRAFLSSVSHELRTPLVILRGAVPLIDPDRNCQVKPEALRQVRDLLMKNCQRLSNVVNTMLDVTEIENGTLRLNLRPVKLHALLEELVEMMREEAVRKDVSWHCEFDPRIQTLPADQQRLRQVFFELFENAVKFSYTGGRITLRTRCTDGWLHVQVANTGVRIKPEGRAAIFEKFYQADQSTTRSAGGVGLGLFHARSIVRLHGGDLELLETTDDETCFRVDLPLDATRVKVEDQPKPLKSEP